MSTCWASAHVSHCSTCSASYEMCGQSYSGVCWESKGTYGLDNCTGFNLPPLPTPTPPYPTPTPRPPAPTPTKTPASTTGPMVPVWLTVLLVMVIGGATFGIGILVCIAGRTEGKSVGGHDL